MKPVIKEGKIDDLILDNLNANKGTEYGGHLMEKSFRENGAGRSILIDKNNRIIAGNKSTETAASIGLQDVIIVESDGTKLIAVKRTDIDIDSKEGRELALGDNATSKANLEWDPEAIQQIQQQWNVQPEDWGIRDFVEGENNAEEEWTGMPGFENEDMTGVQAIIVHFKTPQDVELFGMLINQKLTSKTKAIWYPEEKRGSQTDHTYENE